MEKEKNVCLSDCYRQGKLVAVAEATSLSILLFKPFLISASFSPSVFYYHSDLSLFDAPSLHLRLSLSPRCFLRCTVPICEPLGVIFILIKGPRHVSSTRTLCYLGMCKGTVASHYFWYWKKFKAWSRNHLKGLDELMTVFTVFANYCSRAKLPLCLLLFLIVNFKLCQ